MKQGMSLVDFYNAQKSNNPIQQPTDYVVPEGHKMRALFEIMSGMGGQRGESLTDALGRSMQGYQTRKISESDRMMSDRDSALKHIVDLYGKDISNTMDQQKADAETTKANAAMISANKEAKDRMPEIATLAEYIVSKGIAPDIGSGMAMSANLLGRGMDINKIGFDFAQKIYDSGIGKVGPSAISASKAAEMSKDAINRFSDAFYGRSPTPGASEQQPQRPSPRIRPSYLKPSVDGQ